MSGACGSSCADVEWPAAACPAGYACTRQDAFYWQCKPGTAAKAARAAAAAALSSEPEPAALALAVAPLASTCYGRKPLDSASAQCTGLPLRPLPGC
jgi:hypothetical protein